MQCFHCSSSQQNWLYISTKLYNATAFPQKLKSYLLVYSNEPVVSECLCSVHNFFDIK